MVSPSAAPSRTESTVLLDCVTDAIIVLDATMTLTYANAAAQRFLEGRVGENSDGPAMAIKDPASYVHPDDVHDALEAFGRVLSGERDEEVFRVRMSLPSLTWPVELTAINHLGEPGIDGVVLCFRDLTHEDQLRTSLDRQRELDRHNRALRSQLQERQLFLRRLVRIQSSISQRAPLDDVLQAVVDGAAQLFGDVSVVLRLNDPADDHQLATVAHHGTLPLIGTSRALAGANEATHGEMTAMIRSEDRLVGELTVGAATIREFDSTEHEMLDVLAEHAGIALRDAGNRETVRLALTDQLTGLPNRRLLIDRLENSLRRCRSTGRPVAALFIDLDGFKAVNDSRGHAAGDAVLTRTAERILDVVGPEQVAARLGGDEFVVVLEDSDRAQTLAIAEAISERLRAPVTLDGRNFYIGATIGVAMVETGHIDAEHVLRRADIAMYHGKRNEHGQVTFFEPVMEETVVERTELESQLRMALESDGIEVAYQPILDLRNGTVPCVEALARWTSPTQGEVPPDRFVALAEQMNLVAALDQQVLAKACRHVRDIIVDSDELLLAVNVSPQHLDSADVVESILGVLEAERFDPRRLIVEVTESTAMRDPIAAVERFAQLRAAGVRISLDDFGTGHSSLAQLEQFPLDSVKVDRSFVTSVESSPMRREFLRSISGLVRSLAMQGVVEGVEEADQVPVLRSIDVQFVQGYYFARPVPGDELVEAIALASERCRSSEPLTLFDSQ